MGQCGITSSKTVLVFLNLIFWVSPGTSGEGRGLRVRGCLSLSRVVRGEPGQAVTRGQALRAVWARAGLLSGPRSRRAAAGRPPAPPRRFSLYLRVFCLTGVVGTFAGTCVLAVGTVLSFPAHPRKIQRWMKLNLLPQ